MLHGVSCLPLPCFHSHYMLQLNQVHTVSTSPLSTPPPYHSSQPVSLVELSWHQRNFSASPFMRLPAHSLTDKSASHTSTFSPCLLVTQLWPLLPYIASFIPPTPPPAIPCSPPFSSFSLNSTLIKLGDVAFIVLDLLTVVIQELWKVLVCFKVRLFCQTFYFYRVMESRSAVRSLKTNLQGKI